MNKIFIFLIYLLSLISCNCECENPDCRVSIKDKPIEVVSNVTGQKGTYISPDSLYDIGETTATVILTIFSLSPCHEVIGYGHVWSETNVGPAVLGFNNAIGFVDYGAIDKAIFSRNERIGTVITSLRPQTSYYVRSWLAIDVSHEDCTVERDIIYNEPILFKTR